MLYIMNTNRHGRALIIWCSLVLGVQERFVIADPVLITSCFMYVTVPLGTIVAPALLYKYMAADYKQHIVNRIKSTQAAFSLGVAGALLLQSSKCKVPYDMQVNPVYFFPFLVGMYIAGAAMLDQAATRTNINGINSVKALETMVLSDVLVQSWCNTIVDAVTRNDSVVVLPCDDAADKSPYAIHLDDTGIAFGVGAYKKLSSFVPILNTDDTIIWGRPFVNQFSLYIKKDFLMGKMVSPSERACRIALFLMGTHFSLARIEEKVLRDFYKKYCPTIPLVDKNDKGSQEYSFDGMRVCLASADSQAKCVGSVMQHRLEGVLGDGHASRQLIGSEKTYCRVPSDIIDYNFVMSNSVDLFG